MSREDHYSLSTLQVETLRLGDVSNLLRITMHLWLFFIHRRGDNIKFCVSSLLLPVGSVIVFKQLPNSIQIKLLPSFQQQSQQPACQGCFEDAWDHMNLAAFCYDCWSGTIMFIFLYMPAFIVARREDFLPLSIHVHIGHQSLSAFGGFHRTAAFGPDDFLKLY